MFNERTGTAFNNVQCPTDVVMLVVLWRIRYKLSLRDLVEMFAVRGYTFTHETVRKWETRFTPLLSAQLKAKRRGQAGLSGFGSFAGAARFCTAFDEVRQYFRPTPPKPSSCALAQKRQAFCQRWADLCTAWQAA